MQEGLWVETSFDTWDQVVHRPILWLGMACG
jgi:hypothetical protein